MSRDVPVFVDVAEPTPDGGMALRLLVPAANASDLTPAAFLGTATLNLPEGPR